jgi:Flp pilus assembly protein CpaB
MTYSIRNIIVAIVLAISATVGVLVYTSNVKSQADAGQERIKVFVAARDIPPGTTGEQLVKGKMLVQQEVVRADQAPGALTSIAGLENTVVSQTLYKGTQAVAPIFKAPGAVGASLNLQGNMRAIQVPLDVNAGLIGVIKSGDHVDLLEAIKVMAPGGQETGVVRPLLRNVMVLRAPVVEADIRAAGGPEERGVLLAVSDLEAAKVLWAKQNATIWFLARPEAQATDSPFTISTMESELLDGLNAKQRAELVKNAQIEGS